MRRVSILAGLLMIGTAHAQTLSSANGDQQVRFATFPAPTSSGGVDVPPDEVMVGGLNANVGGLFSVRGTPYSYDTAGALVTLDMTASPLSQSVPGVNSPSGYPSTNAMLASYGELDSVALANETDNTAPLIVSEGVTYPDATHVTFGTPLTADQAKQLRIGMYVDTNSVNSQSVVPTDHTLPAVNYYVSYITGWTTASDGTVTGLTVGGWVVLGSTNATPSVPPVGTNNLDTVFTSYGTPTVLIGSMTKVFGANFVTQLQPASKHPSLVNQATGIEFDYFNNDTQNYKYDLSVFDVTYSPQVYDKNGVAVQMAAGSHFEHVSGGWPTFMVFDHELPNSVILQSSSHFINGNAGTGPTAGSTWVMDESDAYEDGNNVGRLVSSIQQVNTTVGEAGNEMAIEYYGGGNQGTVSPTGQANAAAGDRQGGIVFSPSGYQGGVCLEAQYNGCGFTINDGGAAFASDSLTVNLGAATGNSLIVNGSAAVTGSETVGGTLQLESVAYANLPTGCSAGQEVYVSDGVTPSETPKTGAGTGTLAFCNKNGAWIATTSGSAVSN